MKKTILIAVCFLSLLLVSSCGVKEDNNMGIKTNQAVTFVNGETDADVWLLPDTAANRKTTVWGTATAAGVKAGESRRTPLCEPGQDGHYLFRMIDVDHFYYSANDIVLKSGWTIRLQGSDLQAMSLTVTDETGAVRNTYEVFAARL